MRRTIGCVIGAVALSISGLADLAIGTPSISIGTHHLVPNAPGQVVEIYVTGGDQVEGMDLSLMTANGGPELEPLGEIPPGTGIRGPLITGLDILTGTIFASNNTDQRIFLGESNVYQVAFGFTTTASGSVPAEGLLARVTLDTTGIFEGTFAFSLTAVGSATDFVNVPVTLTDGVLVVGTGATIAADAGADQNVAAGATVQLTGLAVGLSGDLTYNWLQIDGPPVVLADPYAATTTFTSPSGLTNTKLSFLLTVSNATDSRTDTVTITVRPDSTLFSVIAGPNQSVAAGALVSLSAEIVNAGARAVFLEWTQVGGPIVALTAANTATPTFIAPLGITNTELTFEVSAFDSTYEAVDTVTITVQADQTNVLADAGYDQAVQAGATVQLVGTASDPAGTGVAYFWAQISGPAVTLSSVGVANPTFVAPSRSTPSVLEFELRVSNASAMSIDTVLINVAAAAADPDPVEPDEDTTEEASSPTTVQTQQSLFPLNWATSTAIAVGIGLLILAFLLLWILWL